MRETPSDFDRKLASEERALSAWIAQYNALLYDIPARIAEDRNPPMPDLWEN